MFERLQESQKFWHQENTRLTEELAAAQQDRAKEQLPDLIEIRDRILSSWKVAKRAESKERIRAALDAFIEQIQIRQERS